MRCLIMLMCLIFTIGCGTGTKFKAVKLVNVSMDMPKEAVRSKLGKPNTVRQAEKTDEGEVIEIWEYIEPASFWKGKTEEAYAVYFKDGRAYKWGRPKDWIYKP